VTPWAHFCLPPWKLCRRDLPCTDDTSMMACSSAQWWKSREYWRLCNRPLPPLGLELNMRKPTVWGTGLVHAASPLAAATRLHLEEGTLVLGFPHKIQPLRLRGGGPPGQVGCEICTNLLGGRGLGKHAVRAGAHSELPRAREDSVRPAHPTTPPHGGLRGRDNDDPAGHMEHGGGQARLGCRKGAGNPAH